MAGGTQTYTKGERRAVFAFLFTPLIIFVISFVISAPFTLVLTAEVGIVLALLISFWIAVSVAVVLIVAGLPVHLFFVSRGISSVWAYLAMALVVTTLLVWLFLWRSGGSIALGRFSLEEIWPVAVFYLTAVLSTLTACFIRWPEKVPLDLKLDDQPTG